MTEMDSASFIETVVTSTRVRLARNLYSYPFPGKMTVQEAKEVIRTVGYELNRLDDFTEYDIGKIGAEEATLLQEKHLISPDLIRRKDISAAFISSDKEVSVMVNEEDHLREQYILKGFDLYKAYERISGIDDGLARSVSFAYDEKLGYLTACPSNLGTGMRASVMMFLPGLAKYKKLEELLPSLKVNGLTVRGVFGDGRRGLFLSDQQRAHARFLRSGYSLPHGRGHAQSRRAGTAREGTDARRGRNRIPRRLSKSLRNFDELCRFARKGARGRHGEGKAGRGSGLLQGFRYGGAQ